MLGVEGRLRGEAGTDDEKKIIPFELPVGPGLLKVVSMGFLVDDEESALMWRGLMLNRAVQHFLEDVRWGDDSTTCSSTCRPAPATCRWAWPACCPEPR